MSFGGSGAGVASVAAAHSNAIELAPVNDEARKARFDRLVSEHYSFVWRSLRRLGVRAADLDDVVQEVFLASARNLDSIDQERERGFLFQTCVFAAAHARRTVLRRREVIDEDRLHEEVDRRARPDESAESNEARSRLQSILDQIPEELRAVFVLYELERFTMSEIANVMNLPAGTVASRLRKARELFVAKVKRADRSGDLR